MTRLWVSRFFIEVNEEEDMRKKCIIFDLITIALSVIYLYLDFFINCSKEIKSIILFLIIILAIIKLIIVIIEMIKKY